MMKKAVIALSLLMILATAGGASAQTVRNLSLVNGDTIAPARPVTDAAGTTTYYSAFVNGGVAGTTPGVFTLSLAFRDTGLLDPLGGVYGGTILAPNSSFSVTETSGRKSQTTSGTIDAGFVTYRLNPDGSADVISVTSGSMTIWQGKNKSRRVAGNGTLDYGTAAPGAGTLTLYFQ